MQDFNLEIGKTVDTLKQNYGITPRSFPSFEFGDFETCKRIIKSVIMHTDKTICNFEYIPEFDEIADWMTNTSGKGLFLTGDVGRSKTNVVMYLMPTIFMHFKRKVVSRVHAEEVNSKLGELKHKMFIAIDDMGVESIANNYGAKYEPVNRVFDWAEAYSKLLFVSSNLNGKQIMDRYGERTVNRIQRLCRVVKFQGDSLRK